MLKKILLIFCALASSQKASPAREWASPSSQTEETSTPPKPTSRFAKFRAWAKENKKKIFGFCLLAAATAFYLLKKPAPTPTPSAPIPAIPTPTPSTPVDPISAPATEACSFCAGQGFVMIDETRQDCATCKRPIPLATPAVPKTCDSCARTSHGTIFENPESTTCTGCAAEAETLAEDARRRREQALASAGEARQASEALESAGRTGIDTEEAEDFEALQTNEAFMALQAQIQAGLRAIEAERMHQARQCQAATLAAQQAVAAARIEFVRSETERRKNIAAEQNAELTEILGKAQWQAISAAQAAAFEAKRLRAQAQNEKILLEVTLEQLARQIPTTQANLKRQQENLATTTEALAQTEKPNKDFAAKVLSECIDEAIKQLSHDKIIEIFENFERFKPQEFKTWLQEKAPEIFTAWNQKLVAQKELWNELKTNEKTFAEGIARSESLLAQQQKELEKTQAKLVALQ